MKTEDQRNQISRILGRVKPSILVNDRSIVFASLFPSFVSAGA